ncbi:LysM domain-containing protein [Halocella sp. SP3-1]|uniref:LysM peptidoglycan-binding domain-containing protein n=1 Tax=Halocella sp. SP3-1 TaxID=2382161 RepID=UPI000F751674|nr:LysM domain-containing protein [Halocella sp. SP3-1]AZO95792.1 LysM domain-containing protein [Halocella sp. SP3-1]
MVMDLEEMYQNDLEEDINNYIKDKKLSEGKVIFFERDHRIEDGEIIEENRGYFYMYQIEKGKALMSSKTEIIDFVWNDNIEPQANIKDANKIADNYTVVFNMGDEESRGMLKNDLYYIADWGSTFVGAWKNIKGPKGDTIGEVLQDMFNEGNKDFFLSSFRGLTSSASNAVRLSNMDKVAYTKEEIEEMQFDTATEIIKLMIGYSYDKMNKNWSPDKFKKELGELSENRNIPLKKLTEFVQNWLAVYGPALVTAKLRMEKLKDLGRLPAGQENAYFFHEFNKEIVLNRVAAKAMSMVMALGTILCKSGVWQLVILGMGLVISAQPISVGVRQAVKDRMEEGEVDYAKAFEAAVDALKKELNLVELLKGPDKLSLIFGQNTDDPMIAQIEIDAPGVWDMFEIVGKSLKDLDFKGVRDGLNPANEEVYQNEIKGNARILGNLKAIANLMGNEYTVEKDNYYVAFFDEKIMDNILGDLFKYSKYGSSRVVSSEIRKIEKGETLSEIAEEYSDKGVTVESLAEENHLANPDLIIEGDELTITKIEGDEINTETKDLLSFEELEPKLVYWSTPVFVHDPTCKHYKKIINKLISVNDSFDVEKVKNKYLSELYKNFSTAYFKRILLQGIEVGFHNINDPERITALYRIEDLSVIEAQANTLGLGISYTDKSYQDILDLDHNSYFDENGLLGSFSEDSKDNPEESKDNNQDSEGGDNQQKEYDYVITKYKTLDYIIGFQPHKFFQKNSHKLYGSYKKDTVEGEGDQGSGQSTESYEFYAGFGERETYQDSNGEGDITLNGHIIGKNIKYIRKTRFDMETREEYREEFYEQDSEDEDSDRLVLKVEYTLIEYKPSVISEVEKVLKIRYGLAEELWRSECENEITIEFFNNGDYGIELPRYHLLSGTIYADKLKKYKKGKAIKPVDDKIEIMLDSGEAYNYKFNKDKETPNQAEGIIIGETLLGEGLRIKKSLENGLIKYEDSEGGRYTFSLSENTLLIGLKNHQYVKDVWYLQESRFKKANIIEAIKIENFKNGDYGLHFTYDESNLFYNEMILMGTKGKKVEPAEGKEYQIYSNKGYCKNRPEVVDCKYKEICNNNNQSSSLCFYASYIDNEIGYKASSEDGEIYIDGFKISDIKKLKWDGGLKCHELFKKGLYELKVYYIQLLDDNDDVDELLIQYYNNKNKNENGRIIIKDFQNGDYNLHLPEIVVSYLPGSNYKA